MKRSMLGTYWTIWSQQNPTASLGNIVAGFKYVNVFPPSVEYATPAFAVIKTTPPPLAPLGSALSPTLPPMPMLNPRWLFTRNVTLFGSPMGAFSAEVPNCVGIPGANDPVGTVQRASLTCCSKLGGCSGNGPPETLSGANAPVCNNNADPGAAGGKVILILAVNSCFSFFPRSCEP